jgi:hypothetical protein
LVFCLNRLQPFCVSKKDSGQQKGQNWGNQICKSFFALAEIPWLTAEWPAMKKSVKRLCKCAWA